jgi:crossover junction endonuclease MUS81
MQVPQVTEEAAITVLDLYPTLLSLAHAYSLLVSSVVEMNCKTLPLY